MKDKTIKFSLLLTSLFLTLLILEVGLRIATHFDDFQREKHFNQVVKQNKKSLPDNSVSFGKIIKISQNPKIIYDFIPDISAIVEWRKVNINSDGFRGKKIQLLKKKNTIRIVGIGDSIMFGWGVEGKELFLSQLNKLLNTYYPQYCWEFINTAVPGYNTVMEIATLKEKGLKYVPDIVIYNYIGNDLDLPNFIKKSYDKFDFTTSFLFRFIKNRLRKSKTSGLINNKLIFAPFNKEKNRFENNPDIVPEEYKDIVGFQAFKSAMREFKNLSIKHNFIPIVVTYGLPVNASKIKSILSDQGLDLYITSFEKFRKKYNFKGFLPPLGLSSDDPHPSPYGHQIISEKLFEVIINDFNESLAKKGYSLPLESMQQWEKRRKPVEVKKSNLKPLKNWKALYNVTNTLITCSPGELISIPCVVTNTGSETWNYKITRGNNKYFVVLCYRIFNKIGKMVVLHGLPSILTSKVKPGDKSKINMAVKAPEKKGDYVLSVSLLQQGIAWFDKKGVAPLKIQLKVK